MPIDKSKIKWDAPVSNSPKPIDRDKINWDSKPWYNLSGIGQTLKNLGRVYPAFETAANIATSTYGVPISGLIGLAALPAGLDTANRVVEAVQKYLVYTPITKHGEELLEATTYPLQKLESGASAAGGAVAKGTGSPVAGAIVHSAISGTPAVLGGGAMLRGKGKIAPKKIKTTVERGINKGVRPSVVKKEMWRQRDQYMKNANVAVEEIIKNKNNLRLIDRDGNTVAGLPQTLEQFSQAIEQTKRSIFEQYDALAKRQVVDSDALMRELKHNRELINKVRAKAVETLDADAMVSELNQGSKFTIMRQRNESPDAFAQRVGQEYTRKTGKQPIVKQVREQVETIKNLQARNQIIEKALKGEITEGSNIPMVKVSMDPIAIELQNVMSDRVLRTMSPQTVAYALERYKALKGRDFTTAEVQDMVKILNQSNKAFYANPTPEMAGRAYVDSLIANNMRAGLDAAIESTTGIQYAPLKRKYGALRMLETDVTKRAIVDARKNIKGLVDFSDIFSSSQLIAGMTSGHMPTIAAGATAKGIAGYLKYINDPNRIVRNMFKKTEKYRKQIPKEFPKKIIVGTGAGAVTATINQGE